MEARMLKQYYAKGNSVVLSGKAYKHGEPLPKRKEGAYDCLVDNHMATAKKEKVIIKASADDKATDFQAMSEDWGNEPTEEDEVVEINTKVFGRGKK